MTKTVDYYFTPVSPYAYLGHQRFIDIAKRHQAAIDVKPVDLGKIFPLSGGLPLSKRAPQRQAYRLTELKRWREYVGLPLNLQPKFFPVNGDLASRWILAALDNGLEDALAFAGGVMQGVWAKEVDVSADATLASIAQDLGLDAAALRQRAAHSEIAKRYETLTQEAIDRQIFGAPTFVYRDELFWGQDRLDFLDRSLAK